MPATPIDYQWTNPTEVKGLLSASMQSQLAPRWDEIIGSYSAGAIKNAYSDLARILRNKGFSPAQVMAWDDGPAYAQRLAMFWAYVLGAGLGDYNDRDYNKLDCRKELEELTAFSIDGVLITPLQSIGPVAGAPIKTYAEVPEPEHTFRVRSDRMRRPPFFDGPSHGYPPQNPNDCR